MFKAPDIEASRQKDVLARIREIAPFYIHDLDVTAEKGNEAALLYIFAGMMDMIIQRLNAVPDKNLIAFLDMMSVKLLPPQPAMVPVTFILSEGTKENVTIPQKTQVAAGDIIFETDKTFVASPAKLLKSYSLDFSEDTVFAVQPDIVNGNRIQSFRSKLLYKAEANTNIIFLESTIGLQKGDVISKEHIEDPQIKDYYTIVDIADNKVILDRTISTDVDANTIVSKVISFAFFEGENLQQHILYFGDSHLFDMKSKQVNITIPDELETFEWEYYGENNDGILWWHSLDKDAASHKLKWPESQLKHEIKELEINRIENRWIRCIINDINKAKNIKLINKTFFSVSSSSILPDIAFCNDIPLDLSQAFYPLGKVPRLYDTFYIGSQECFSKKGANVTINIQGSPGGGTPDSSAIRQLSWEYWDGNSWRELVVDDNTHNFTSISTTPTTININDLPEIKSTKANGAENLWIRAKLVAGHYGEAIYKEEITKDNKTEIIIKQGTITPPQITSLTLSYNYDNSQPCENYLVYSNLEYRDMTEECRSEKIVAPFEVIDGSGVHFYLGFNQKPVKGPVSIFFDLDTSKQENKFSPVRWEYCSQISEGKEKWDKLEVLDNTKGFTQSDTIEFVFSDMPKTKKFGQELYWIRATELNPNNIKSKIKSIDMNTSWASQMQTFVDVLLGSSAGNANQIYFFPKQPVVSAEIWVNEINSLSESERQKLLVDYNPAPVEKKDKDGNIIEFWVKWMGVDNLFIAEADSRTYEIDRAAGYIKFGDNNHGRIPAIGHNNIKANYQIGGGIKGNAGAKEINILKTSVAFVDKVSNPIPAGGGSDIEIITNAAERGSHNIKNRDRVITEEDYEYMVKAFSSGIARVKCLSDSGNINGKITNKAGNVAVVIIPSMADDKPVPSIQLVSQVRNYLNDFAPATADIYVVPPHYWFVNIDISITAQVPEYIPFIEKDTSMKLKKFLHPLSGGYDGKGWEFGRIPYLSDIYALVEKIDGVDHINSLKIALISDLDATRKEIKENDDQIYLEPYEMICNGSHTISVI